MICKICEAPIMDIPSGEPSGAVVCGDCLEMLGKLYTQKIRNDYCGFCGARIGDVSWSPTEGDLFCFPCWGKFEGLHGHSPGPSWRAEEKARIEAAKRSVPPEQFTECGVCKERHSTNVPCMKCPRCEALGRRCGAIHLEL
jgi:hypothetical protein